MEEPIPVLGLTQVSCVRSPTRIYDHRGQRETPSPSQPVFLVGPHKIVVDSAHAINWCDHAPYPIIQNRALEQKSRKHLNLAVVPASRRELADLGNMVMGHGNEGSWVKTKLVFFSIMTSHLWA